MHTDIAPLYFNLLVKLMLLSWTFNGHDSCLIQWRLPLLSTWLSMNVYAWVQTRVFLEFSSQPRVLSWHVGHADFVYWLRSAASWDLLLGQNVNKGRLSSREFCVCEAILETSHQRTYCKRTGHLVYSIPYSYWLFICKVYYTVTVYSAFVTMTRSLLLLFWCNGGSS